MILQRDTASCIHEAITGPDDVVRTLRDGLRGFLRYFVVSLSADSAPANKRATRILHATLKARSGDVIMLVWLQRCDGDMAHIILKLVIKRTTLLNGMFSLANLFKRSDYRSTVLKALRAELETVRRFT